MILCQTHKGTACYVCGQKAIDPYCNLSHSFVAYPYVLRSSHIHIIISEMKGKWLHNCQASISKANRWCLAVSRCCLPHFSSPSHSEPESLAIGMQLNASMLLQCFLSSYGFTSVVVMPITELAITALYIVASVYRGTSL